MVSSRTPLRVHLCGPARLRRAGVGAAFRPRQPRRRAEGGVRPARVAPAVSLGNRGRCALGGARCACALVRTCCRHRALLNMATICTRPRVQPCGISLGSTGAWDHDTLGRPQSQPCDTRQATESALWRQAGHRASLVVSGRPQSAVC